jgi:hypothetical protein
MPARRPKGSKPSPTRATYAKTFEYPDDRHPVRAYLVGLGDDSERVTLAALHSVADILSGGKVSAMELAWHGPGPRSRERSQRPPPAALRTLDGQTGTSRP